MEHKGKSARLPDIQALGDSAESSTPVLQSAVLSFEEYCSAGRFISFAFPFLWPIPKTSLNVYILFLQNDSVNACSLMFLVVS